MTAIRNKRSISFAKTLTRSLNANQHVYRSRAFTEDRELYIAIRREIQETNRSQVKCIRHEGLYRYTRESPCRAHAPRRSLLLRMHAVHIMSLPDGVMLPVMHRVTNDESAGLARMPTWDDYSGLRKITMRTYAGPTVESSTWAVITASAVRRTVTHVNAHHGSKAAILAPEKLLFRLALSKKCLLRG